MAEISEKTAVPTQLDQLVNDYLDTKGAIEKHRIIADQLAEQIIAALGIGGRHELLPGVGVRVQAPAAEFNAAKARQVLTNEQYQAICEPKPSVALAAALLPGVLVDQCKTIGAKPSVRSLTTTRRDQR